MMRRQSSSKASKQRYLPESNVRCDVNCTRVSAQEYGVHNVVADGFRGLLHRAIGRYEGLEACRNALAINWIICAAHAVEQEAEFPLAEVAHISELHLAGLGGRLRDPKGVTKPEVA